MGRRPLKWQWVRIKVIRIRMGETMGVSFNGAFKGTDHEGEPPQARADDKCRVDSAMASGGFGRDSDDGSPVGSRSVLIHLIEAEIIPRLFLTHRHRPQERAYSGHPQILKDSLGGDEVFARLFLGGNTVEIVSRLQSLLDSGIPRERVYLDIVAPVARTLSVFWEEGRCSFEDMAKGLACIDEVVQKMSTCACTSPTDSR